MKLQKEISFTYPAAANANATVTYPAAATEERADMTQTVMISPMLRATPLYWAIVIAMVPKEIAAPSMLIVAPERQVNTGNGGRAGSPYR